MSDPLKEVAATAAVSRPVIAKVKEARAQLSTEETAQSAAKSISSSIGARREGQCRCIHRTRCHRNTSGDRQEQVLSRLMGLLQVSLLSHP